jgi:hypothetical protein
MIPEIPEKLAELVIRASVFENAAESESSAASGLQLPSIWKTAVNRRFGETRWQNWRNDRRPKPAEHHREEAFSHLTWNQ